MQPGCCELAAPARSLRCELLGRGLVPVGVELPVPMPVNCEPAASAVLGARLRDDLVVRDAACAGDPFLSVVFKHASVSRSRSAAPFSIRPRHQRESRGKHGDTDPDRVRSSTLCRPRL